MKQAQTRAFGVPNGAAIVCSVHSVNFFVTECFVIVSAIRCLCSVPWLPVVVC